MLFRPNSGQGDRSLDTSFGICFRKSLFVPTVRRLVLDRSASGVADEAIFVSKVGPCEIDGVISGFVILLQVPS